MTSLLLRAAPLAALTVLLSACNRDLTTTNASPAPSSSASTFSASLAQPQSRAASTPTVALAASSAAAKPEPEPAPAPAPAPAKAAAPTPIVVEHERVATIGFVTNIDEKALAEAFPGSTSTKSGDRWSVKANGQVIAEIHAPSLSPKWIALSTPAAQGFAGLRVGSTISDMHHYHLACQRARATDPFARKGFVLCSRTTEWNVFYEIDAKGTAHDGLCTDPTDCFIRDDAQLSAFAGRKIARILWKNAASNHLEGAFQ